MARNGSGTYTLPPSNPVVSGTVIESEWANDTMADIAAALTQSIAYNGETVPINNLPMGGFHHTGVSDPTSRNQYATLGMVQDGRHYRVQGLTGVDNLVGTLLGGATAYVAGATVSFFVPANNTGPMTLNYNGIGAKSLVSASGLPLTAGQLHANDFVLAYYDGAQFKILSNITATVATTILALSTTGQERPGGGAFTPLTIATGTSINVPAGTAWIVPPNSDDPSDAVQVSWATQALTLTFLATNFTTTIAVNNFGQIIQFAGRVIGANLRNAAVLGVVEHITGVANKVITKPTIFRDDGYRGTDVSTLLGNTIINGGKITPNGVAPLQLDISAGSIFMPGGDANTTNSPNVYAIPQQGNIQFRPMAGQNTLTAVVSNAPVGNYDPNGAGVVTVIPNNADTVIHRLYFLYGSYIWVYGQKIYTSVENALSMIEWDRTQYKPSIFLMDATLVGEIIAIKNTASLSNIAQAAIVAPGGINFSIGSPGGISEAPIDGTPYGRQDAAWTKVLRQTAPTALNSLTVNGPSPFVALVKNPAGPGAIVSAHNSGAFNWFTITTVNPDDKTYFQSYNPNTGALRYNTVYDLATGNWDFPTTITINGSVPVVTTGVSVDNDIARFSGASGRIIKPGLKYQTSQTDLTAGALLAMGAFGVGASLSIAAGTNLNTVVNSGFYRILGTPVNGPVIAIPTPVGDGELLVIRGLDTITQIVSNYVTGRTWSRAGTPPDVGGVGAWSPWQLNVAHGEGYNFNGVDLNNIRISGVYNINNNQANRPTNTFGVMFVMAVDVNSVIQIYTEIGVAQVEMYVRTCAGNAWNVWKPLCTTEGPVVVTPNADYFDANAWRVTRSNKTVTMTGAVGRNTPMLGGDVCGIIPAGFIPQQATAMPCICAYSNGAVQLIQVLAQANGQISFGSPVPLFGTAVGACTMAFGLSWLIA